MRTALVAILVLAGCSSSSPHSGPDASGGHDGGGSGIDAPPGDGGGSATDGGTVDAPAGDGSALGARMPQAVVGDATDIMATPKGMAITWANDPFRADEDKFFGQFGASSAWADQTAEYGVGALTATTIQGHIAGNAPAKITEAQALAILKANLTGANPAWGAPDQNTIYMFFIPKGTVLDDGSGSLSCSSYDGYHYDTVIGGVDVAYAFSAVCDQEAQSLGITDLQDVMITAGHETVEAATDPRTANVNAIGWGQTDDAHIAWTYATEGELGDLCEYAATQDWVAPPNMDYSIQRTWSNAAAAAGHDPCVGAGTEPYYQSIPADADTGTVTIFGNQVQTKGTKVAVNATGTIHLQVYSDQPSAGPFTIKLYDWDGTTAAPILTFVQPTGTYHVGDTVDVPVTVKKADSNVAGGEPYEVDTIPMGGGPTTAFYAFVVQ